MSTLVLDATTKSIVVAMSGAAATTNPDFTAAYADDTGTVFTEGANDGALNGVSSVTLVAAPATSTRRIIKTITVENKDTAAVTLTISYNNNSTLRTIAKVTLQVGDTWSTDGTYDTNGNLKTTVGIVNLAQVTGTLTTSNGGTGLSAYTAGDLSYYATGTALSKLGIGAANSVLTSSGTAPQWTTTLGVSSGGTGAATLTGVLKGNGTSALTAATAGTDYVAPGTATTFTATQSFSGSASTLAAVLTNAAEVITISATAATGTINFDVTTQSVLYYTTNASANFTLNFRGSSGTSLNTLLSTGQSVTVVFLNTNGATAYYNNAITVDGSAVTPKWQGGTAPTSGNASAIDTYSYVIIKTGSAAFTVLASQTKFA